MSKYKMMSFRDAMMTEKNRYSLDAIPKWDPLIARKGALDSLRAEAWLLWQEAFEMTEKICREPEESAEPSVRKSLGEQCDILMNIGCMINECIPAANGGVIQINPKSREFISKMHRREHWIHFHELQHRDWCDAPSGVFESRIDLFRAHIREVELMFCYEDASPADQFIQWMLNDMSHAAYVAVWGSKSDWNEEEPGLIAHRKWKAEETAKTADDSCEEASETAHK